MSRTNDTHYYQARFPTALYRDLKRLAEYEHRSINQTVIVAVQKLLDERKNESKKTTA